MSTALRIAVTSSILALTFGCVDSPLVVQGAVIAYDEQAQTVTVCDDLPPNPELVLSLAGAEVGKAPNLGDVVRVAYRDQGGTLKALRLMNLTRQEELQGKKH
jgi:hypothetical protein